MKKGQLLLVCVIPGLTYLLILVFDTVNRHFETFTHSP